MIFDDPDYQEEPNQHDSSIDNPEKIDLKGFQVVRRRILCACTRTLHHFQ